jgi:uncharacterized protein YoxC
MSPLVQVCVVIVTVAIVVLVYRAVKLMGRLDSLTKAIEGEFPKVRSILEDLRLTSKRVHGVVDVADDMALTFRRSAMRVERLVDRFTSAGSAAVDTLVAPVRRISALWQGIRTGSSYIARRWASGSNAPVTKGEFHG